MTTFPIGYHDAVALAEIHESPWNPRKTFDLVKLGELAASLKEKGCLTPLVARPRKAGVEIGAGHRRRRAAEQAGLAALPVVVRALSDTEFLELLVIENDQREDVHPLEQGEGYKRLMLQKAEDGGGYNAKRIAERIGRSEKYVYDRVKLLNLIPLAQQLFLAGKMSAGHAILIARLTKEQQERIVGMNDDSYDERHLALFQSERSGEDLWDLTPAEQKEERKNDPLARYKGYKPVSVRELDGWINDHVRLDPKQVDPFLFPAVVSAVETAPKALVPLTREGFIQDEARDGKVRTWGPRAWKEVTDAKKACKYTQPGIIVVGAGRGDVLQVCLSSHRDGCAIHWSKESKEAAQMRKIRAGGGSTRASDRDGAQVEREKRERASADALRGRFKLARPKFLAAIAAAVEKATVADVAAPVLQACRPWNGGAGMKEYSTPGRTPDSILRYCAFTLSFRDISSNDHDLPSILTKQGKLWGLDVPAILEAAAPAPKEEKKAEPAKALKKPRKMGAIARPKKKAAKK